MLQRHSIKKTKTESKRSNYLCNQIIHNVFGYSIQFH